MDKTVRGIIKDADMVQLLSNRVSKPTQPNEGLVDRPANGCSQFWPQHNNMRSFINNQFLFTQMFYVKALEGSPR